MRRFKGVGISTSSAFGAGNSFKTEVGNPNNDGDLDAVTVNQNQQSDLWLNIDPPVGQPMNEE